MIQVNDVVRTKDNRLAIVESMAWLPYRGSGRWVAGVRMCDDDGCLVIVATGLSLWLRPPLSD